MRFSVFIRENLDVIVAEWELFARTIPASTSMSGLALRDHCREILSAIADDMETRQTDEEQESKSKRLVSAPTDAASAAESHGTLRHLAGFDLMQLFAEFRALRASVLSLWSRSAHASAGGHAIEEITRFNEGLDQALAESIESFSTNLSASRDMFIGVLGHDLRGPLSAISASNMLLASTKVDDHARRQAAARVARSVRAMTRLIADLLDYTRSRLGAGIPIEPSACDVGGICAEAMDSVQTSYPSHTFSLRTSGDLSADIDSAKMEQALANLLANAGQHGVAGGEIVLNATGDADSVVVTVSNQGPPIAAEALCSVFEPLTRLHTASHEGERSRTSMGLGLFIVREIVNGHFGSVTVASSREGGTVFTVVLPKSGARAADASRRAPAR